MESVYNKSKTGETIFVDGHYFVNCMFTNCKLVYCGGEFGWTDTQFLNCHISIEGNTIHLMNFLRVFNLLRPQDQVPQTAPPPSSKLN